MHLKTLTILSLHDYEILLKVAKYLSYLIIYIFFFVVCQSGKCCIKSKYYWCVVLYAYSNVSSSVMIYDILFACSVLYFTQHLDSMIFWPCLIGDLIYCECCKKSKQSLKELSSRQVILFCIFSRQCHRNLSVLTPLSLVLRKP